jgi:hypothetical protein
MTTADADDRQRQVDLSIAAAKGDVAEAYNQWDRNEGMVTALFAVGAGLLGATVAHDIEPNVTVCTVCAFLVACMAVCLVLPEQRETRRMYHDALTEQRRK